jgi:hypothetical protein
LQFLQPAKRGVKLLPTAFVFSLLARSSTVLAVCVRVSWDVVVTATTFALENGASTFVNFSVRTSSLGERG